MMLDLIKKVVSTGLEMQDKMVDFLDELVKKGKIDEKEREKFIKDLDKKLDDTKDKSEEFINEVADKLSIKSPFAAKKEVEDLEKKVAELEKKLKKAGGEEAHKEKAPKSASKEKEGAAPKESGNKA